MNQSADIDRNGRIFHEYPLFGLARHNYRLSLQKNLDARSDLPLFPKPAFSYHCHPWFLPLAEWTQRLEKERDHSRLAANPL